jgi:ubiquinol-cytochrome c reductase cytochrome b subunit
MNAVGVGAFFNLLDFGQMYSWHIFLLPVAVVALVAAHVLLVRKHGVVPPLELHKRPGFESLSPAPAGESTGRGTVGQPGAATDEASGTGGPSSPGGGP